MKRVNALVVSGYGINCEKEVAVACEMSGAYPEVLHIGEILSENCDLEKFHLIVFPGGFSFGDELGAAKAFANRLAFKTGKNQISLKERLIQLVEKGHCILGICNGFQLLVKLGILPKGQDQQLSLVHNDSQKFESLWVHHRINPSKCIFTKGMNQIYLPIRHAEGKLVGKSPETIETLFQEGQVVMQYADQDGLPHLHYPCNPNGSLNSIAGLCDPTGRVFGMMAHPEAALFFNNHPHWQKAYQEAKRANTPFPKEGEGLKIFQNAVEYLKENL